MSTLQELLAEIDNTPVEKTAAAKDQSSKAEYSDNEITEVLESAGVISKEEVAVEKTASTEGGKKMSSLYDFVTASFEEEQEKTAAVVEETTETEGQEEGTEAEGDLEKIAASEDVQSLVDMIGATAGDIFNDIFDAEMEKVAAKAGIAPDGSMKDKGPATGMFGEVGDVHVETNRPADSEKAIDTAPKYYDMDHGSNALVGLCVKKKMISRQMHGRS